MITYDERDDDDDEGEEWKYLFSCLFLLLDFQNILNFLAEQKQQQMLPAHAN